MTYESQAVRDARIDLTAVLSAVIKRLPRIIVVTLLLLVATFAILLFVPRVYESSAGILVEPRSGFATSDSDRQSSSVTGLAAGVVSSQMELIKSRETLLNVVDQLDLRSVPEFNGSGAGPSPLGIIAQFLGRKPAPANVDEVVLGNLLGRLTVIQERDSAVITILARSTDPELAARIANGVAAAHVARRAGLSLSDTAEASGWLGDEVTKLRVAVTDAENAVANFKVQNDLFTGTNNTSLADQDLSSIATQISAAQERKSAALSRASLIRSLLERGAPIDGIADVRASVVVQQLTQQKAQLQGEQAQKAATLLANHPTIRALVAQINELNSQINIEGRRVAEGLESEAEIEAGIETSLRAELTRAKGSASAVTTNTVTLDSLEREAKAKRDLLESYLQRYGEANSRTEANSALPDVRVVSLAAASVSPASPKTPLILLAVGLSAAAAQIGLVILGELMSGRAIAAGRRPEHEPEIEALRPDELQSAPFMMEELEPEQRWDDETPADLEAEQAEFQPGPPEAAAQYQDDIDEVLLTPADAAPVAMPVDDWVDAEPEPAAAALDDEDARARFIRNILAEHGISATEVPGVLVQAAEPVVARQPAPELRTIPAAAFAPRRRSAAVQTAFADLSSDLALGRTRLVLLAGRHSNAECQVLAEALVADALDKGLSVALIDAGSAQPSEDAGLSDLSTEAASFGDVVHKSTDNTFAEVPWGQGAAINPRSPRPLTLVEALGDIYEVVVLMTGQVGSGSTLPLFADLEGRLVLVASDGDEQGDLEATRERLAAAGFGRADIVITPDLVAA